MGATDAGLLLSRRRPDEDRITQVVRDRTPSTGQPGQPALVAKWAQWSDADRQGDGTARRGYVRGDRRR